MRRDAAQIDDPFRLNAAQREAAYDLAHHRVLGSGAGCGKTRVLVARIIRALDAECIAVGEIAAITFTEKAAGEMVMRLRQACRMMIGRAGNAAARRRWQTHLRDLERARISTIHGFCARLLREHAAEAGIDPRFEVLDELPAAMLREEMVADVTADALAADDDAARLLAGQFGLRDLRKHLGHLLKTREAVHRAVGNAGIPSADALLDRWRRAVFDSPVVLGHCKTLRRTRPLSEKDNIAVQRAQALAYFEEAEQEQEVACALGILHQLAAAVNLRGGSDRKWASAADFEAVKSALDGLRRLLVAEIPDRGASGAAERHAAAVMAAMWALFTRCETAYQEAKARAGQVDFADLLIRARDLLRNRPDVRDRIRRSIRHLLVDEMQDTDFLQLEIIQALAEGAERGPVLFAVGDAKQSIYRFRGADVEVLQTLSDRVRTWPDGHVSALDESYRSHRRGIEFVNRFFERLFGTAAAPFEVPYEGVRSAVSFAGPDAPVVNLVADSLDGELTGEGRRREGQRIAAAVRDMVEVEHPLVRDPRTDSPRQVEYRDVALLFRSFHDVGVYERALEEAGVPFYTVSGRAFFGRPEVNDVLLLLKAIDTAHDEVSLIGALRSPLVGLSDEALFHLTDEGRRLMDGRGLERLTAEDREAWSAARRLIERLRAIKDRAPVSALITEIIDATGCDAGSIMQFAGRRRLANLRRLVDLARELERFGTLSQVIERLDDLVTADVPGQEGAAVEEAGNVVRLMTVHAAKGLEFPVVILPDLGRNPNREQEPVVASGLIGLAAKVTNDKGTDFTPLALSLARQDLRDRDTAESKRTLYVAMTRARDRLILSGVRDGTGPWLKWFEEHTQGLDLAPPPWGQEGAGTLPAHADRAQGIGAVAQNGLVDWGKVEALAAEGAAADGSAADAAALGRRLEPLAGPWTAKRCFGAREFADYERCPYAYRLRYLDGFPDPLPGFEGVAPAPRRGQMAHSALERLDLTRGAASVPEALDYALGQADALSPEEVQTLRDWTEETLRAFLATPVFAAIQSAGASHVRRELPFVLRLDDLSVRGQIDCLWRDAAGWHLLDYKTDQISADEVPAQAAAAALQLGVYAMAAAELIGQPLTDATLYYLTPGVPHRMPVAGAASTEARARIGRIVASIRRGEFPAVHSPSCGHCAYAALCSPTPTGTRPGMA